MSVTGAARGKPVYQVQHANGAWGDIDKKTFEKYMLINDGIKEKWGKISAGKLRILFANPAHADESTEKIAQLERQVARLWDAADRARDYLLLQRRTHIPAEGDVIHADTALGRLIAALQFNPDQGGEHASD